MNCGNPCPGETCMFVDCLGNDMGMCIAQETEQEEQDKEEDA